MVDVYDWVGNDTSLSTSTGDTVGDNTGDFDWENAYNWANAYEIESSGPPVVYDTPVVPSDGVVEFTGDYSTFDINPYSQLPATWAYVTGTGSADAMVATGPVELDGDFNFAGASSADAEASLAIAGAGITIEYQSTLYLYGTVTDEGDLDFDNVPKVSTNFGDAVALNVGGDVTVEGKLGIDYKSEVDVYAGGTLSVGSVESDDVNPGRAYLQLTVSGDFTDTGAFTDGGVESDDTIVADDNATVLIQNASSFAAGSVTASNFAKVSIDVQQLGGSYTVNGDNASIAINDSTSGGQFSVGGDVQASGFVTAPDIKIDGTLEAQAGAQLNLTGQLDGAGVLQVDAGSTLILNGAFAAAAALTLDFNGADGALDLYDAATQGGNIPAEVKDFAQGDVIDLQALQNAQIVNEQIVAGGALQVTLLGELDGAVGDFQFDLDGVKLGQVEVSPAQTGGTDVTLNDASTPPSAYVWAGKGATDAWSDPANWSDANTGAAATQAPGANDFVTLTGPTAGSPLLVAGPGAANTLILAGQVELTTGAFTAVDVSEQAGAVAMFGAGSSLTASGDLIVGAGATLMDSGAGLTVTQQLVIGAGATVDEAGHLSTVGDLVQSAGATFNNEQGASFNADSVTSASATGAADVSYNVVESYFTDTGAFDAEGDTIDVTGGGFHVDGATTLGGATFSAARDGNSGGDISLTSIAEATSGATANTFTVADNLSGISIGDSLTQGGEFDLDAGQTLSGGGSITAPSIVIDGTLAVDEGQTETLNGLLSGTGTLEIDDGLLSVSGPVLGAPTITFAGAGGTLVIDAAALDSSLAFAPVIDDFGAAGDEIELKGVVATTSSYANGVLTLSDGGAEVASLTLSSANLSGQFLVAAAGGDTYVEMTSGGDTGTPGGTNNADAYVWTAQSGSWDNAANWQDVTASQNPASVAPGANDLVTITAPGASADIVTGDGDASTLTLGGPVVLDGNFTTAQASENAGAAVTVADGFELSVTGAAGFTLGASASLTADGAVNVADDLVAGAGDQLSTGSNGSLDVLGTATLGGASVTAEGTATATFAALATPTDVSDALDTNFTVGATASIEIGSDSDAQTGAFVLDGGQTLSGGGTITAAGQIVIDGTLEVQAGDSETLVGQLTGSNSAGPATLEIDQNATLTIDGSTDPNATNTISFGGTGAALDLSANTLDAAISANSGVISPALSNFGPGDSIDLQGFAFSSLASVSVNKEGDDVVKIAGTMGGATGDIQLTLQGQPLGNVSAVLLQSDGQGGTLLNFPSGYYWTGDAGDDDWSSSGNWQYFPPAGSTATGAVPGASDAVVIIAPSGGNVDIAGPGDDASLTLAGDINQQAGLITSGSVTEEAGASLQIDDAATLSVTGDFAAGADATTQTDTGGTLTVGGTFTEAQNAVTQDYGTLGVTGDYVEGIDGNLSVNGSGAIGGALIENAGHTLYVGPGASLTVGAVEANPGFSAGGGAQDNYQVQGSFTDTGAFSGEDDSITVQGATQLSFAQPADGVSSQSPQGAVFTVEGAASLGGDTFNAFDGAKITIDSLGAPPSGGGENVFNVDALSSIELGGANAAEPGQIVIDSGQTLTGGLGIGGISGFVPEIVVNGTLIAGSGETQELDGVVSGAGSFQIDDKGTLYFNNASFDPASQLTVTFNAPGGVLSLSSPVFAATGGFAPVIDDFAKGDAIFLNNAADVSFNGVSVVDGDTVLSMSVTYSGSPPPAAVNETLTFQGTALDSLSDFSTTPAPYGGAVEVVATVACFVRGARILTARGEVAVEDLRVGDLAVTASGARRPIVWTGHRGFDVSRHPDPAAVRPVVVRAHAFSEGAPQRDLWLSPGHNVAWEGVLTPISCLVNGRSVAQVDVDQVEYWHVELDAHDVILAEGLPAESYLDTGNRPAFVNGGAYVEAHPDFAPRHWADTCLPLALDGPAVAARRSLLLARLAETGCETTAEADAHVMVDGLRVEPIRLSETKLVFALPSEGREIALRSRVFTPAHMVAECADSRALGLCVAALQIDGAPVSLADDAACASGWHKGERQGETFTHRWTTGSTPLPAGARIVIVDLAGVGRYWRETQGGGVARSA